MNQDPARLEALLAATRCAERFQRWDAADIVTDAQKFYGFLTDVTPEPVTLPTDMLEVGSFYDGISDLPLIQIDQEVVVPPAEVAVFKPSAKYTIRLNPVVVAAILVKLGVKCDPPVIEVEEDES